MNKIPLLLLFSLTCFISCQNQWVNYELYSPGTNSFSDEKDNQKLKYKNLYIRYNGSCSITELTNSIKSHGGGSWTKTDYPNVLKLTFSSNTFLTHYRLYVRIDLKKNLFIFEVTKSNQYLHIFT